jgi:hypothetical protein
MRHAAAAVALSVVALIGLAGCSEIGNTSAGGGTGGSGISYGAISEFGSIFVNGVEFETTGATITRDGVPLSESDLHLGMTVEVLGDIASRTAGSADTVTVKQTLRGRVDATGANELTLLGQTVLVDDITRFHNNVPDLGQVQVGDTLEVHGFIRSSGVISATFIQRRLPPVTSTVRGIVGAHDATAQTFSIGSLTVSYSGATVVGLPAGSWNGRFVALEGSCAAAPCIGFSATRVEPHGFTLADAPSAELEGLVTDVVAPGAFAVGSQTVVVDAFTVYSGGTVADVATGAWVEVEGMLNGGVLTAARITFRDNIRLELDVAGVNLALGTLSLTGLPGISIRANDQTQYSGGASSLLDLIVGTHVRVRGRMSTANTVTATSVQLRTLDKTAMLQAPVQSISAPTLMLLERSVDTTGITGVNFRDIHDNAIGAATFFSALAIGDVVKVRGSIAILGDVAWNEIQSQD